MSVCYSHIKNSFATKLHKKVESQPKASKAAWIAKRSHTSSSAILSSPKRRLPVPFIAFVIPVLVVIWLIGWSFYCTGGKKDASKTMPLQ